MDYPTPLYLFVFLPAVLCTYQLMPRKKRWIVLLGAGYVFFYLFSGALVLFLIGTTLFTYLIGNAVAFADRRDKKLVLKAGIAVLLGILAYLKYFNFFAGNVNALLSSEGETMLIPTAKLLLPIGISFYTLQAVGYLADVYWGKVRPEKHPFKLALYLAFFPQIMEGPISMYSQTADQLWEGNGVTQENLKNGYIRIFWGLFKKILIADRLSVLVNAVFDSYTAYSGALVAAAAIAYTVQLYMEFSGCMDIVIGSGQLFGVTLPENFRCPFLSRNASEFWRRWHITLGVWFKTYVFYPVSVSRLAKRWSRFGKKHAGKYLTKLGISALALFPVWLCNGLWHGPRWNYIFYGMYYFVILLAEIAAAPAFDALWKKLHVAKDAAWLQVLRIGKTWLIIFTGEMFFRADGVRAGFHMFLSIFYKFSLRTLTDGTLLKFGLDAGDWWVILAGCAVTAVVDLVCENGKMNLGRVQEWRTPVRWALYYGLILSVLIFGAYGPGYQKVDLIYAGF